MFTTTFTSDKQSWIWKLAERFELNREVILGLGACVVCFVQIANVNFLLCAQGNDAFLLWVNAVFGGIDGLMDKQRSLEVRMCACIRA